MKNIFKNVKFGDKYITRDNRIAVYTGKIESLFGHNYAYRFLLEDEDDFSFYTKKGKSLYYDIHGGAVKIDFEQLNSEEDASDDIVSCYNEPNDEV